MVTSIPRAANSPASLTLALLGPAHIACGSAPLSFGYEKVRALLVFLAVERDRAHRRAMLADMLWPDKDEASARHSLSQALFRLRQALAGDLGASLLLVTRDTVRLNPGAQIWLDVAEFHHLSGGAVADARQLQRAIALYRGEFLEGSLIGDSAAFEEWALLTREHLHRQACDVLRQLAETGDGAWADREAYARRWVAFDPLCEEAHRRLMRALAESGQRAAALAQFEHCRHILEAELAIEPEPATVALRDELRQFPAPAPPALLTVPARAALPVPSTRFINRARELADIGSLLVEPATRLLTITGPGGVGKTRLALHVAAASAPAFEHGVCFVSLAPVREPGEALAAIALSLGIQQYNARSLGELVRSALAPQRLLLLLDNCEHLLPALATTVAELLATAPRVVVLATSRVTLHLSHERRFPLAPLGLEPDAHALPEPAELPPAMTLFVERARAARPSVELDYAAIGAICRRLDGLPLAIELAATRIRLLTPRALLERMEQRLPLLSGGPRDAPERQQTLYATIAWSYELLDAAQQALFRRLAVFAGGWTVAATEAVCADTLYATEVIDGLATLLDASLIYEEAGVDEPRCAMLETIREYALAQLENAGELHRTQELHARHLAALAAQAAAELNSPAQGVWLKRIDAELDNLRAALRWCDGRAVGLGLRLASDLGRYWDIRGYRREGYAWLEMLLASAPVPDAPPPTDGERAAGLMIAGMLAHFLRDSDAAKERLRESLALYQQLGDWPVAGRVLNILGNTALYQGTYVEAEHLYRKSLALRRAIKHTVGIASTVTNLALVYQYQGDLSRARSYYEESRALYRQLGDRAAEAFVLNQIARILLRQGEPRQARQLHEACHATAVEIGYQTVLWQALTGLGDVQRAEGYNGAATLLYRQSLSVAAELHDLAAACHDLCCFAALACAEGYAERAASLLAAAETLSRTGHLGQGMGDPDAFERHVRWARAALDPAAFRTAWARGQAFSLEQAVALALDDG